MIKFYKNKQGFTLIELLIVIGIIAILAAIIFVAVDPQRRFREARNSERWSSVNSMLNAYLKSTVDNQGTVPISVDTDAEAVVSGAAYEIGTNGGASAACTATTTLNMVDFSGLVDQYLASVPVDPSGGDSTATGYYFYRSPQGRVTIGACEPEEVGGNTPAISVSR